MQKTSFKIIALNGSPHHESTVHAGLSYVCGELEKEGVEVERIHVGGKLIHGCLGCGKCRIEGLCAIHDDITNECIERVRQADGILLSSPVYYGGIAGGFKCLLDRMFYAGLNLQYKPAAALVATRRAGGSAVHHQLCNYLTLAGAVLTPTTYWNIIYGINAEETKEDAEGAYVLKSLGKNLAWLLKTLEAGKKMVAPPELGTRAWTNFIH
jgi:multimeric flavodoxin WrbA